MPNIAVETVSSTAWADASGVTISKPSGVIDGELLIAIIAFQSGKSVSTPSGWTLKQNSGAQVEISVYWKIASSEPASWLWQFTTGTGNIGGVVLRVSGNKSTPADQSAAGSFANTATPSVANTITPSAANSLLVMAIAAKDFSSAGASGYAIATSNPSWTERADIANANFSLAVATAVRPEVTATGNSSAILTGANTDGDIILASFLVEPNVTVSPTVVSSLSSIPALSIIGGAVVSPSVVGLMASIPSPSVVIGASRWKNTPKPAPGSIYNTPKPA